MEIMAMANLSSYILLATIIAGYMVQMLVKSTRFYPYFGFCHLPLFQAKIVIKSCTYILLTFVLFVQLCW